MKNLLKILPVAVILTVIIFSGCESNDTSVNSVYIPQPVARKTLFEFFSNSGCQPCIEPHRSFLEPLEEARGVTINDTSVIIISYQVNFPNPLDSIYFQNPQENDARSLYYNVAAAPQGNNDGSYMGQYSYTEWSNKLNASMNSTAYLDITISNSFNSSNDSGTVTAHINTLVQPPTNQNNKVHVVLIENNVPYISAPNGIKIYNGVMRDMVDGPDGANIALSTGQTVDYSISYGVRSNWKMNDCYLVVFVQNLPSKEVYGVERIKVN
jgi:hypothetical protein